MPLHAIIVSIGDELLIGQVVNSNAAFIAQRLHAVGVSVGRTVTVGDDEGEIVRAFREALEDADIMVATGGLGPTHDDITKSAVCKFFGADLVKDEGALKDIVDLLQHRNIMPTDVVKQQALVPRGASVIQNKVGTAPGLYIRKDGKYFFALPGVPYEMEAMVDEFIVPLLRTEAAGSFIVHRTLNTTGISESALAERLGDLATLLGTAKLAFLPSITGLRLRISAAGSDRRKLEVLVGEVENHIRQKADQFIFGVGDETLEAVIGRLLTDRKMTLAVAESCTGGLLSHRITNVPGSSQYFDRTVVSYSNQSKLDLLEVPGELVKSHGAVSKEVAMAMAKGIRETSHADIGISTTGIAGPSGGSAEKPVGLVWVGYSDKNETTARKFNFGNDRLRVKERAAQAALDLIRRKILKID